MSFFNKIRERASAIDFKELQEKAGKGVTEMSNRTSGAIDALSKTSKDEREEKKRKLAEGFKSGMSNAAKVTKNIGTAVGSKVVEGAKSLNEQGSKINNPEQVGGRKTKKSRRNKRKSTRKTRKNKRKTKKSKKSKRKSRKTRRK